MNSKQHRLTLVPAGAVMLAVWLLLLPGTMLAQDGSSTYTVVAGDTLAVIAQRLGVPLDVLIEANQITNPSLIRVGQVLLVPGADGTVPTVAMETTTTAARPGDTPATVAGRLGVESTTMATLNGVAVDARFFPGQPLRIPAEAQPEHALRFGAIVAANVPVAITQGRTGVLQLTMDRQTDVRVTWNGLPLPLIASGENPQQLFTFVPAPALIAPSFYPLTISYTTGRGVEVTRTWWVTIAPGAYETQAIIVPEEKDNLLAPDLVTSELELVTEIWSTLSPQFTATEAFQRPVAEQWETTSPFGTRRAYGGAEVNGYHSGQDFGAPAGTEVRAPAPGTISMARPLQVRGNAILIDHGKGVFTGYWHLNEMKVSEGEQIAAGDVIGLVGTTGLSTGNHLHWELRISGVAVDPMQFLEKDMVP